MESRLRPSRVAGALAALTLLAAVHGVASAHEVAGSRFDAPIPLSLLFAGAGATVAATALWLAVAAGTAPSAPRRVLTVPPSVAGPLRVGLRGAFLAAVAAALVLGVAGRQVAAGNVATVFVWPVWFRGVALLSILFGTPWRTLSPWRTVYRGLVRVEGRSLAVLGEYPARLGEWPAVAGFVLLVGVAETLTVVPRSPRLTSAVVAGYGLVTVGGAVCYGPAWLRRGDPLGVLYRLFGRVAPVDLSPDDGGGYAVAVRPPWAGCLDPVRSVPLAVFAVATVYTVSFDGFTNTSLFQAVLFGVRDALGTGSGTGVLLYAVGLGGFVAAFGLACLAVERLGAGTGGEWVTATLRFAPTLLPIAAAYEVAHNYPYVLGNLGRLVGVALRPVAPVGPVDPLAPLSLPAFWGSQVALIVLGHVVAVVAAHGVAVERYDAAARRGHRPLVALMVGYTVLSLWIVSQPVVSG